MGCKAEGNNELPFQKASYLKLKVIYMEYHYLSEIKPCFRFHTIIFYRCGLYEKNGMTKTLNMKCQSGAGDVLLIHLIHFQKTPSDTEHQFINVVTPVNDIPEL